MSIYIKYQNNNINNNKMKKIWSGDTNFKLGRKFWALLKLSG